MLPYKLKSENILLNNKYKGYLAVRYVLDISQFYHNFVENVIDITTDCNWNMPLGKYNVHDCMRTVYLNINQIQ